MRSHTRLSVTTLLLWFSTRICSSNHNVSKGRIFSWQFNGVPFAGHTLHMFFTCILVGGQLGCFISWLLWIVLKWTWVSSLWHADFNPSRYILSSESLESTVALWQFSEGNFTVFPNGCTIFQSHPYSNGFLSLHCWPPLLPLVLLIISIHTGVMIYDGFFGLHFFDNSLYITLFFPIYIGSLLHVFSQESFVKYIVCFIWGHLFCCYWTSDILHIFWMLTSCQWIVC